MQPIPVTSDLELRPFTLSDAPMLLAAIQRNRDWLRPWLPWLKDGYDLQDARAFLSDCEDGHATGNALTTGIWASGTFCGAIGLHRMNHLNRSTSIGYWIDKEFSARGIMTAACGAMVAEGFQNLNLNRIEIRCATGNERSCAIPRRLGFQEEGLLHEAEWLYDHWVDLKLFALIKRNWSAKGYRY